MMDMIGMLIAAAFLMIAAALLVAGMTIKHLFDEIGEMKDEFEYHKKIHKYERLMAEQKIKEFIQLLNQLEKSINKEENENQD